MFEKLEEAISRSDSSIWNNWCKANRSRKIVFRSRHFGMLGRKKLAGFDFSFIEFRQCVFPNMTFYDCKFENAIFVGCKFEKGGMYKKSDFRSAIFKKTEFLEVNLIEAILKNCEFNSCQLIGVDFRHSSLIESKFNKCTIQDCDIYGANLWDIDVINTIQKDLRIPINKANLNDTISIDDLQFGNIIYLLLDNSNYKKWVDSSKSRSVLILGRFGKDLQKKIMPLKETVRFHQLSPIVFDFEAPTALDLIESIVLLSFLSKFIIVDITGARSVPAELQAILANLMIPVVPIIQHPAKPYGTFTATNKFKWVLPVLAYSKISDVQKAFKKAILEPVERMNNEIYKIKHAEPVFNKARDFF